MAVRRAEGFVRVMLRCHSYRWCEAEGCLVREEESKMLVVTEEAEGASWFHRLAR